MAVLIYWFDALENLGEGYMENIIYMIFVYKYMQFVTLFGLIKWFQNESQTLNGPFESELWFSAKGCKGTGMSR